MPIFDSIPETHQALTNVGYITDEATAAAVFFAARENQSLLIEGPAGAGKTELALSVAKAGNMPFIRLQCYQGITDKQAIGDFDRALQDLFVDRESRSGKLRSFDELAVETRSRKFFNAGPLLEALESETRYVLLIDEIDIQYNYMRDGKVLIPSGSRAIGKMDQANASGYVGLSFSSLQLPDGNTIPISAVGLDKNMMPIKGIVTGKNLAKQFLVATMAGLGEATAMVAGGSNMSGAYSQSDMIKEQASMNIGNAADSQIQMLNNGQHIVVILPAGTEINVVFVKPPQANKTSSH